MPEFHVLKNKYFHKNVPFGYYLRLFSYICASGFSESANLVYLNHRLNMEISKVYLGSMSRDVHSHWLRPRNPLYPPALGPQGADPLPLPLRVAKTGRNHLNEAHSSPLG
jgi:hypothetical protein